VAAASALVGVASAENLGFGDGDLENDVRFVRYWSSGSVATDPIS